MCVAATVTWVRSCAYAEYVQRKAWAVRGERLHISEYRLCWGQGNLQLFIRPQIVTDPPTVAQFATEFQRDGRPSTAWSVGRYEHPLEPLESWAMRHKATTTGYCGVGLWRQSYAPAWGDSFTYTTVFLPCWLLIALSAILPLNWLRRRITRSSLVRRWRAQGRCARCGYDLRASVGRCPECGTPIDTPKQTVSRSGNERQLLSIRPRGRPG